MTESTKDNLGESILRILTEKDDKNNGWVIAPVIAVELGLSSGNPNDVALLCERVDALEKQGLIEVTHHLNSQPFRFSGARIKRVATS